MPYTMTMSPTSASLALILYSVSLHSPFQDRGTSKIYWP
jgi:hypothetical protein